MDDARAWQTRPLDDVYPVVFLDALVLKIRDGGWVQRKACYLALAITMDGDRDVLGMWFQDNEGAKFWMQVLTDLKTARRPRHPDLLRRRAQGFPEAIEAVYPQTRSRRASCTMPTFRLCRRGSLSSMVAGVFGWLGSA